MSEIVREVTLHIPKEKYDAFAALLKPGVNVTTVIESVVAGFMETKIKQKQQGSRLILTPDEARRMP